MKKFIVILLIAAILMLGATLLGHGPIQSPPSLLQGYQDPYPLYNQKDIINKMKQTECNKTIVGYLQSLNTSDYLLWLYKCDGEYYALSHKRNKFFVPLGRNLKEGDVVHSPYGYNADFMVHFNASEYDC